jgi:predicted nucleic acid-binding protein
MKIIADTCIWMAALNRSGYNREYQVVELNSLLKEENLAMIGLIRAEILAGIQTPDRMEIVRETLRSIPDEEIITSDFEIAASYLTICRTRKLKSSLTDCLICAVSNRLKMRIFTTDKHFYVLQKHLPILLHHS